MIDCDAIVFANAEVAGLQRDSMRYSHPQRTVNPRTDTERRCMTITLENTTTDIPVDRLITLIEAEDRLHGLVKALTLRGWLGSKLTEYRLGSRILVDAAEVDGLITCAGAREVT